MPKDCPLLPFHLCKAAANYKHTAQTGLRNKEMYWIMWLAVKREGGLQDLDGPYSLWMVPWPALGSVHLGGDVVLQPEARMAA